MQSSVEAAEVISGACATQDYAGAPFAAYEQRLVRRYHHFRRFATGFYDPARSAICSLQPIVPLRHLRGGPLSILGGSWRPSATTASDWKRSSFSSLFSGSSLWRDHTSSRPRCERHYRPSSRWARG
jgi:hypothetical protein